MASPSSLQQDALRIFHNALNAVKSDTLLQNSVQFKDGKFCVNPLSVQNKNTGASEKGFSIDLDQSTVHIIGGGKSVLPMARSLLEQMKLSSGLSPNYVNGCLSFPSGSKIANLARHNQATNGSARNLFEYFNVECHHGALNNLPDISSQYATKRILQLIDKTCNKSREEKCPRKPLFIVLLSGGGSACLTMPKGISLDEKLRVIKSLVSNGVDIKKLNSVRRCLSEIKGGKLASSIARGHKDAQIVALIISDVIGDSIEFIASGPTYINPDLNQPPELIPHDIYPPSRIALELLTNLNIDISPQLVKMLKSCDDRIDLQINDRVHNFIIGNNRLALEAAIGDAKYLGYEIEYLGNEMHGDVDLILHKLLTKVENVMQRSDKNLNKVCIIGGGEATVNLKTKSIGQGGRAQEMALRYLSNKFEQNIRALISDNHVYDDIFLAAGTDGQDGPTKFAGCLSSWSLWDSLDCERDRSEIQYHAETHDSTNFWLKNKKEWLIETGLTGTNVMDIYMILLNKRTDHHVTSRSHL